MQTGHRRKDFLDLWSYLSRFIQTYGVTLIFLQAQARLVINILHVQYAAGLSEYADNHGRSQYLALVWHGASLSLSLWDILFPLCRSRSRQSCQTSDLSTYYTETVYPLRSRGSNLAPFETPCLKYEQAVHAHDGRAHHQVWPKRKDHMILQFREYFFLSERNNISLLEIYFLEFEYSSIQI